MGNTYTRQSSYSDGDVITAAHTNDEFNQLLAAFQASSGHTHDGTANEGGPITKMLGTSLTLGDGTAGTDITVTFDGETNDGVLKWMEDEDYFEFSDDILVASTEKLQFRDTAIYLNSSTDGQLDIVADTEVQIAATTIDINGNADISGNLGIGGNLTVTGTTTFNGGTMTLGDAATDNVVFGADVNSSIIPNTDNTYDLGSSGQEWRDIYIDGTAYLDAINFNGTAIAATATELNIIDGDTSATSTTLADADRVVVNDAGTMKQVALTDFETYFESALDTLSNVTTVGALNSGSITSGFGTIDTGSSTITTTGLITGGSLDIDDVLINGTTIGHTDDTDLITLANGVVTVAGELDATTLDISGNADIDGTLEADAITVNGTALNTVIAGVTVTNATNAVNVYVDESEDDNVNYNVVFENTASSGNGYSSMQVDSGGLTFNPYTNVFSAQNTATTLSTASQPNVTSLGTLTTLTVDNVIVNGSTIGHTSDTDLMTVASGVLTVAGEVSMTTLDIGGTNVTSTAAELNILDGVTSTATELNIMDGNTSATSTTLADADRVVVNDAGTMKQVALTDFETYFESDLDTLSNVTSLGTLTTLTVDNVIVNGTTIGHTDDTDLITLADGIATVAGEVSMTTLDIGGTNVASTAAELNIMDGDTAASSTTLVDADRVVTNDNGTMKQVALTDVKTYLSSAGFSSDDPTALAIALG